MSPQASVLFTGMILFLLGLVVWPLTLWRAYRAGFISGRIEQQNLELERRKQELARVRQLVLGALEQEEQGEEE